MAKYTQDQLDERNRILQSQKLLWKFLDSSSINNLIHLFNRYNIKSKSLIETYIENERNNQGLDTTNITIESKLYKTDNDGYTILLDILKDKNKFVHLSIHLSVNSLEPKNTGVIHISKNIYKPYTTKSTRGKLYALISVQQPVDKPHSLVFSIADGYITPSEIKNTNIYEPILQKEMDIILTVLNRLFDEDDEYYVGNKYSLIPIHKNTNTILKNMNIRNKHVERKNKGLPILPSLNANNHSYTNYIIKNRTTTRKHLLKPTTPVRTTRKEKHKPSRV